MSHPQPHRPSLLVTLFAATVLFGVGQKFLSAEPPEKNSVPSTDSKKDLPPTTKPAQPDPSPATSGGTLVKRKKPSDSLPAKTSVPEETPQAKAPAGKMTPTDDKPLKLEAPPGAPGKATKTPVHPEKLVAPEDEALLKSLNKDETEPDDVERLERAIAGMREAQQRIEERDAGKGTQEIQTRVVKDLATIIEALQNPKSPPQDQNSQDQNQKQDQKNQKKKQGKQRRQLIMSSRQQRAQQRQQEQQRRQQARNQGEDQPPEKSKDTSNSLAKTKAPAADKDRQQQLVKDVWGHLPPNVREELLNAFSEKYLPKYDDMVRRYYEALAEKNRGRSPGR